MSWNKKLQKIQVLNENPKIEADKPKFKKLTYIPFFFATLRNCRSSHLHFSCSDSFEFLTVYLLQFFNGFSLRTVFLASELKNFRYFDFFVMTKSDKRKERIFVSWEKMVRRRKWRKWWWVSSELVVQNYELRVQSCHFLTFTFRDLHFTFFLSK